MRTVKITKPGVAGANVLRWSLAGLALLLAWDASALDLALARLAAPGGVFALREHWLLTSVLHQGARLVSWGVALWLLAGVWWPTGVLRRLSRGARVQWLAGTVLALLLVSAFKHASRTSCPWDVTEFGGVVSYVSHWAWSLADGGPGHCFPAGHASAGFAFLGGYFVLREEAPRQAAACLAAALAAGLVLGLAQQLRGAHFMSHTLWTAWLCWVAPAALNGLVKAGRAFGGGHTRIA